MPLGSFSVPLSIYISVQPAHKHDRSSGGGLCVWSHVLEYILQHLLHKGYLSFRGLLHNTGRPDVVWCVDKTYAHLRLGQVPRDMLE